MLYEEYTYDLVNFLLPNTYYYKNTFNFLIWKSTLFRSKSFTFLSCKSFWFQCKRNSPLMPSNFNSVSQSVNFCCPFSFSLPLLGGRQKKRQDSINEAQKVPFGLVKKDIRSKVVYKFLDSFCFIIPKFVFFYFFLIIFWNFTYLHNYKYFVILC